MARKIYTKLDCAEEALKYTSRGEFQKLSRNHHDKAWRSGWLDEICNHMAEVPFKNNYSKEDCQIESLKYTRRVDFRNGSKGHYRKASRKGWLNDICSHMIVVRNTYTKEDCTNEALKYTTIKDFRESSPHQYEKACKQGWIDSICIHMIRLRTTYTKEDCIKESSKYTTTYDFKRGSPGHHQKAYTSGWLDEVCVNLKTTIRCLTKAECHEESLKYTTRTEFKKLSKSYYNKAWMLGWLDNITTHMVPGITGFRKENPAYFYTALLTTRHDEYVGFGITNNIDFRCAVHRLNCNREGISYELLSSELFEEGEHAYKLEKYLKQNLPIINTGIDGFKTEAILRSYLNLLTSAIRMAKIAVL